MKAVSVIGLSCIAMLSTPLAHAEGSALSAKIGTLGLGLEFAQSLSPAVNLRLGLNNYTYGYTTTKSDINYDFDLKLQSLSALLDWHPGGDGFRISGGLLSNGNKLDAVATPVGNVDVGGTSYPAALVGTLSGKIEFNSVAPYVGIGWDNLTGKNRGFGVAFDLGVAFQGSPKVDLTANGLIAGDAGFQADLATEEQQLKDDLKGYKYYPVLSLGLTYIFN